MATYNKTLAKPLTDARGIELWLQHAAGKILFEDARQYAIDKINEKANADTRAEAIDAINNAMYGIMMILDGVTGCLKNSEYSVILETKVKLLKNYETGEQEQVSDVNLANGDGMCMGYHGWMENDFGKQNVVEKT